MSIFDILGPVMVGPSSSHTAGAARIRFITARQLFGEFCEKSRSIFFTGHLPLRGKGMVQTVRLLQVFLE